MINIVETLNKVKAALKEAITANLEKFGLKAEITYSPELKGCIADIGEHQIFIPVQLYLSKNGSYSATFTIPELDFLPEYELIYRGKIHRVRASDQYHAAMLVLNEVGYKGNIEKAAAKLADSAIEITEDEEEAIVVEKELPFEETASPEIDTDEILESFSSLDAEGTVKRILQNEFDQIDVPVVVSSVVFEDETKGVYKVESIGISTDYRASLPFNIERKDNFIFKVHALINPIKAVFKVKQFDIKLPDGEIITIETTSEDKALRAAEQYWMEQIGNIKSSQKEKFEIVGMKEYEISDFNEDVLINPWVVISDDENKIIVEI